MSAPLEEGWFPAAEVEKYNPRRYEFVWNDDFTAFHPIKLRWWDDASYSRYQCGDDCEETTTGDS